MSILRLGSSEFAFAVRLVLRRGSFAVEDKYRGDPLPLQRARALYERGGHDGVVVILDVLMDVLVRELVQPSARVKRNLQAATTDRNLDSLVSRTCLGQEVLDSHHRDRSPPAHATGDGAKRRRVARAEDSPTRAEIIEKKARDLMCEGATQIPRCPTTTRCPADLKCQSGLFSIRPRKSFFAVFQIDQARCTTFCKVLE